MAIGRGKIAEFHKKSRGEVKPERCRVHLLLGHREMAGADVFERVKLDLFEADDLGVDADLAVGGDGS